MKRYIGLLLAISVFVAAKGPSGCRNSLYENARKTDPFSLIGFTGASSPGNDIPGVDTSGQNTPETDDPLPKIQFIRIDSPRFALLPGSSRRLSAKAEYSDGSVRDITKASTWISSNKAIAAVSDADPDKGTVTADPGAFHGSTAEIMVEYGDATGIYTGTVCISVVEGICVSPLGDDAGGTGSPDAPYRTIGRGMTQATRDKPVLLSGGSYIESVVMAPGVSLYGGYANDFADRDSATNESILSAVDAQAITVNYPAAGAITIEGLTALGPPGSALNKGTAGILISNAGGATIRHCVISGGGGDWGTGNSTALHLDNASLVRVSECSLSGGSGKNSFGLFVDNNTQAYVYNSLVNGGNGTVSSIGINLANGITKEQLIRNNTIDGGNASGPIGIYISSGPSSAIENNIIFIGGTGIGSGIYEDKNAALTNSLLNNDIYRCAVLFHNKKDGDFITISSMEAYLNGRGNEASNNLRIDLTPYFSDPGDLRLLPSAPREVTHGALDGSRRSPAWEFNLDMDGLSRTGGPGPGTGWTMGAYEKDN